MKFQAPRFIIVTYGSMSEYVVSMTTTLDQAAATRSAQEGLRMMPAVKYAEVHAYVEDQAPLEYRDPPIALVGSREPDLSAEIVQ